MGYSIARQNDIHMKWLDRIVACMVATETTKPSWTAQDKFQDLCETLGRDLRHLQARWCLAIFCLERSGVLETDNDQNGFVFVQESRARVSSGEQQ